MGRVVARMRKWSRVSRILVGVLVALVVAFLGLTAWLTIYGTNNGIIHSSNAAAVSNGMLVVNVSYHLAAKGHIPSSFKGVTLGAITAVVESGNSHPVPQGERNIEVTTGASTGWYSISVDLCADGPACHEIIVAVRGTGARCWYQRATAGIFAPNVNFSSGNGYAGATRQGKLACKASKPPRSGWASGIPNFRLLEREG